MRFSELVRRLELDKVIRVDYHASNTIQNDAKVVKAATPR
jgi:hypothetical protein